MIEEQIAELLNDLDQKDDIPMFLLAHGHRGFRGNSCSCPVAVYLKTYVNEYITVGASFARWGSDPEQMVVVPGNVSRFIGDFDSGKYPWLLMDHSEVGAYV